MDVSTQVVGTAGKKRVCVALFLVNYFNYFHVVVMRGFCLLIGSAAHKAN